MENLAGSEALRAAAPDWSLAGDRRLLALLHEIHQKIMSRCEDTNNKLEQMVTALDTASVSLQNVNNRFMALSNSQFVESRVYDDDTDVTTDPSETKAAVPAPSAAPSPLAGLLTLERLHEPVPICDDSDSDSDSEQPTRIILKPRDPYSARPLPHIIGSEGWKNKWHVGLMPEDSDSDSSVASRVGSVQCSESESETEAKPSQAFPQRYRQSSTSSSERDVTKSTEAAASETVQPTQADIAAELARRLGGCVEPPRALSLEDEEETQRPVQRKIYKPQQPTSATIFSDEPPPLAPSRDSDTDSQSDDDIFAEINRKAPYSSGNKAQSAANVDIFADLHDDGDDFEEKRPNNVRSKVQNATSVDIFADDDDDFVDKMHISKIRTQNAPKADIFGDLEENDSFGNKNRNQNALVNEIKAKVAGNKVANAGTAKKEEVKQNKPLFDEPEESDLFEEKKGYQGSGDSEKTTVKKPIGAISLFGDTKGAASIGAAILNRNRRKSSSEESNDGELSTKSGGKESKHLESNTNRKDSSYTATRENIKVDSKAKAESREKTVFNNIDKEATNIDKAVVKGSKNNETRVKERDIFDDLFEKSARKEIKNVNPNKTYGNKKVDLFSDDIFDDIDDIFSSNVVIKKTSKDVNAKSIFDDDDGLFSEVDKSDKSKNESGDKTVTNVKKSDNVRLFDSNNELFSNKKYVDTKKKDVKPDSNDKPVKSLTRSDTKSNSIFDSDDELFSKDIKVPEVAKADVKVVTNVSSKAKQTKSLFDDNDNDSDDIFSNIKPPLLSQTPESDCKTAEIIKSEVNDKTTNQSDVEKVKVPLGVQIDRKNCETPQAISVDNVNSKQEENSKMQTSTDSVKIEAHTEKEDGLFKSTESQKSTIRSPSFFDDDEEIDDLFRKPKQAVNDNIESKIGKLSATKESENPLQNKVDDVKSHKTIEVMKKPADMKSPSIFDSDSDDDMFAKPSEQPKNTDVLNSGNEKTQVDKSEINTKRLDDNEIKTTEIFKESLPVTAEIANFTDTVDNATRNLDANKNIEEDTIVTKTDNFISKIKEPSLFDDAEPPVFEKPKEPKRSKNINALFDDDSDDESLFFKKNELISDEKVDDFPIANEEKILTIFHDEPPAIDVDFGKRIGKSSENPLYDDGKNDMDTNYENITENSAHVEANSVVKPDNMKIEQKLLDQNPNSNEKPPHTDKTDGVLISGTEPTKPIGKLKPMQFNINVNTLLPGASPKKVVKIAPELESQLKHDLETSKTANEPATSKAKIETVASKLVKSASFEETPDSPVLNNKLSKDRAKIQVKRRPSTRRARKEAARKSAIDFVDGPDDANQDSDGTSKATEGDTDSYGNSKDTPNSSYNSRGDEEVGIFERDDGGEVKCTDARATDNEDTAVGSSNDIDFSTNFEDEKLDLSAEKVLSSLDRDFEDNSDVNTTVIEQYTLPEDINDVEDLFKQKVLDLAEKVTEKQLMSSESIEKTRVLNINDTDVYIFNDPKVKGDKSSHSKTTEITTKVEAENEVQYIGRVYKQREDNIVLPKEDIPKEASTKDESKNTSAKKLSIFDDLSDDDCDLFGGNSKVLKSKPKNAFSATNDNEDLFATKSSVKREIAKSVGVKKSLFGDDDDDDDDLFGVKRKSSKEEPKPPTKPAVSKPSTKTNATATVFDDPLSIFGDDGDDM